MKVINYTYFKLEEKATKPVKKMKKKYRYRR